jgi:hypothetical protein
MKRSIYSRSAERMLEVIMKRNAREVKKGEGELKASVLIKSCTDLQDFKPRNFDIDWLDLRISQGRLRRVLFYRM